MRERTTWERRAPRRFERTSSSGLSTVLDSLNEVAAINQRAMASVVEGVGRMMVDMAGTLSTPTRTSRLGEMRRERRHRHHRDCDCDDCDDCRGRCDHDQCYCECCIGDVDLVVYTRLGERRVIPVTIENPRRREKEISLELSQFTSRGGRAAPVTGQIDQPTSFTLQPCEERQVVIRINVAAANDTPTPAPTPNEPGTGAGRRLDVDECEVAYADLRVIGCEMRPIRIAVAILPYDCGEYEIDCGCGCC